MDDDTDTPNGWLVLERQQGETVLLRTGAGELIRIMLRRTRGKQAWLAFQADRSVKIWRGEHLAEPA